MLDELNFDDYVVKNIDKESWLITILLPCLATFAIVFVIFTFMTNRTNGGGNNSGRMMNFGKNRARLSTEEAKKFNFESVAGLNEEKRRFAGNCRFLKIPEEVY